MKLLSILIFICILSQTFGQSKVLHLKVNNFKNLTGIELNQILSHLKQPDNEVYLTSSLADSLLLQLINGYRLLSSRKTLQVSKRLDTLSYIVACKNAKLKSLAHYNQIPELSYLNDLLNFENLHYLSYDTYDSSRICKRISYEEILHSWQLSPGHNRNLLRAMEHEVAATKVLVKITLMKRVYNYTVFSVFELDSSLSERELNDHVDRVNRTLLHNFSNPKN